MSAARLRFFAMRRQDRALVLQEMRTALRESGYFYAQHVSVVRTRGPAQHFTGGALAYERSSLCAACSAVQNIVCWQSSLT